MIAPFLTTWIELTSSYDRYRRVYHIVTDHAFWVESIVTYHRIYRKKCITKWRITLSIYYTYLTHDFIKPNVEEGSFMPLVLIHTGIVKYLWQILILYSIQFAYPTYSGSPFLDEIAIMIRHYVIHPYLKIRHYVIHPTIWFNTWVKYRSYILTSQSVLCQCHHFFSGLFCLLFLSSCFLAFFSPPLFVSLIIFWQF